MSEFTFPKTERGNDPADHIGDQEYENKVIELVNDAMKKSDDEGKDAPTLGWQPIQPLTDELLPVMNLTDELLPKELRGFIKNAAARLDHTAPDFVAMACMVSMAGLIGGRAVVQPKRNDPWPVPITLWGMAIGSPSAKKSPPLKEVQKIITRIQQERFRPEYEEAITDYEVEARAHKSWIKALDKELDEFHQKKKKKRELVDIKAEMKEAATKEPIQPLERKLVTSDPTVEALQKMMAANPLGMMLYRDELSGLLSRLSRDDMQHERSFYLECFDGLNNHYDQARITRDDTHLQHTILTIYGGIQPGKLEPLLRARRDGGGDDGLIERFQFAVYPDVRIKASDIPRDEAAYQEAVNLFERLAELPESEEPTIYRFSDEAQALYWEWYEEITRRTMEADTAWQSILGKYPALAAKIALLLHIAQGDGEEIGSEPLAMALDWVEYLESHQKRIQALGNDPHYSAKRLIEKLPELARTFTVTDFANKNWSGLRKPDDRQKALDELVSRNYLHAEHIQTGGRPVTKYLINPDAFQNKKIING
jgi:hypothetical protein